MGRSDSAGFELETAGEQLCPWARDWLQLQLWIVKQESPRTSPPRSDAVWANADGGVITPTIPIVAVGAVPPDLNIDALGHLELLGLG